VLKIVARGQSLVRIVDPQFLTGHFNIQRMSNAAKWFEIRQHLNSNSNFVHPYTIERLCRIAVCSKHSRRHFYYK